jgi:hypothetical protein
VHDGRLAGISAARPTPNGLLPHHEFTTILARGRTKSFTAGDRNGSLRSSKRHLTPYSFSVEEFLRRFVQHVLPRGFVKVRHYGLLANRHREEKLKTCRRLLLPLAVMGAAAAQIPPQLQSDPKIAPAPMPHCPHCGGCRFLRFELPKEMGNETLAAKPCSDTS